MGEGKEGGREVKNHDEKKRILELCQVIYVKCMNIIGVVIHEFCNRCLT